MENNRHKLYFLIVVSISSLLFGSYHAQASGKSVSEKELAEKLEKASGETVQQVFYADYDQNGTYEAFAIVSKEQESENTVAGSLWFVSAKKTKKLNEAVYCCNRTKIVSFDDSGKKYFFSSDDYAVCTLDHIWKVSGSSVKELICSDNIEISGTQLCSYHTELDAGKMSCMDSCIGRTEKPYYFYYKNGKIHEYGGVKMSEKVFCIYQGAAKIMSQIKKDYPGAKITQIYFRKNDTIQMNFKCQEAGNIDYHYAFLSYNKKKQSVIWEEYGDGSYHAALLPKLAEYPRMEQETIKE